MTIASLYNTPTSPELLAAFSFANADEHTKIQQKILSLLNINLPLYILDPIPVEQIMTWAEIHQQAHTAQNAVLGITGNDLTDVDFSQPSQVESWVYLHALEHRQAAQILLLT